MLNLLENLMHMMGGDMMEFWEVEKIMGGNEFAKVV